MNHLPEIPRYELREEVGSGGMSVVYRAWDTNLDREVAVKVLHRHLAARAEERARFRREAQAVARLRHPNILEIHDYSGEDTGEAYIVSEFIRGPTLRRFAETVGFGLPEIGAMVAERVAFALEHAHGLGIIHRDIKPENVMIQDDGSVKLTDFGVARMVDRDERMTMTGALLGSPAHMPPEVVEGKGADARSDVFSLGTVLYWLTCGALPFRGGSPAEVLRRIVEGRYEDPRAIDPRVSDPLVAIVRRALQRDPEARQPSAAALRSELSEYLAGIGLGRVEAELEAFFADPPGYKAALKPRLVEAWLERADAALAGGRLPEAIAACDRVLALAPGHVEAQRRLAKIRRRRVHRRLVGGAGALAAVAALVLFVATRAAPAPTAETTSPGSSAEGTTGTTAAGSAHEAASPGATASAPRPGAQADPSNSPTPAAASVPAGTGASAAPGVVPGGHAKASGPGATPAGSAHDATPAPETVVPQHTEPHAEAHETPRARAVETRVVRVIVPTFADIWIDGDRLVKADREGSRELPLGMHRLTIQRDGFLPIQERFRVVAGRGAQELRKSLVPRNAVLHVASNAGAVVSVDGEPRGSIGPAGLDLPVPFEELPGGRYRLPRTVHVRIEEPGFVPFEKDVVLTPGRTERVEHVLEPQP